MDVWKVDQRLSECREFLGPQAVLQGLSIPHTDDDGRYVGIESEEVRSREIASWSSNYKHKVGRPVQPYTLKNIRPAYPAAKVMQPSSELAKRTEFA